MKKIVKYLFHSILNSLIAITFIWGSIEFITFFAGEWLRNILAPFWPIVFVCVPVIYGFVVKPLFKKPPEIVTFDLINRNLLNTLPISTTESKFYQGAVPSWIDIIENKDINRDLLTELISISTEWKKGILLIPILANAGEGKSTFLKRLAFELYKDKKIVLFSKRGKNNLSIDDVKKTIKDLGEPIYILIDDASHFSNIEDFILAITEIQIPTVIFVTSRFYEWNSKRSIYGLNLNVKLSESKEEYSLSQVSDEEVKRLIRKLSDIEMIRKIKDQEIESIVQFYAKASKRSFLVLIILVIENEDINHIIQKEIEAVKELGPDILNAYRYICLMASVNSYITTEMIQSLVHFDNLTLDLLVPLRGFVELIGNRIYVRHNRIGIITSDILFEGSDDTRGDMLCSLIDLAANFEEFSAISPIHISNIPSNQDKKISENLLNRMICCGRFDILSEYFTDLSISDHEGARVILAQYSPELIKKVIFPDITFTADLIDISLTCKIECKKMICKVNPIQKYLTYENRKKWFAAYLVSAEVNDEYSDYFSSISFKMLQLLAMQHPERKYECFYEKAELLRKNFHDEEALPLYKQALECKPNFPEAKVGLIVSLYFNEKFDEAYKEFELMQNDGYDMIFYLGEEEIIEEFLIRIGKLLDVLNLRLYSVKRNYPHMRKLLTWSRQFILAKDGPIEDSKIYSAQNEEMEVEPLQFTIDYCRGLSEEEKNTQGLRLFGEMYGEIKLQS